MTQQGIICFLYGASEALIPPTPPVQPGNQPVDEKALNFPQLLGFTANYSTQPITPSTEPVNENTQP
jgi:hypothetical protein